MIRTILHMDMDAFYASVEQLDNPRLRGRPVIVGGTSNRGVVSAASYEARRFGVHSAMPIFQARQLCPQGVFMPVRMDRYKEMSERAMEVLQAFSPLVEQVSIDEAYMDISGTQKLFGSCEEVGRKVKEGVRNCIGLTCSVGIGTNKFLAKIASEFHKPDGLTIIAPDEVSRFLSSIPIEKVPGVGPKTLPGLLKLGIDTLGRVSGFSEGLLVRRFGQFGKRLVRLSRGIDDAEVAPVSETKSVSSEETMSRDTADIELLRRELMLLAENVGRRLRRSGLKGKTVALKLKSSDFRQITRQATLNEFTSSSNRIYEQGLDLLNGLSQAGPFRLIGIGVSNLVSERFTNDQLILFDELAPAVRSWEEVERAMDRIRRRFGPDAIKRGAQFEKLP
jgi:DNA polymerase-4